MEQAKQKKPKKGAGSIVRRMTSSFSVNMNQRPIVMIILLLVGINLAFLLIAAALAMVLNPVGYSTFFHALADVFSFLIVPATVAGLDDTSMLVLGTVVVIVGMLLFTGTIIALITTTLRNYLADIGSAKGKLNISNHVVILRYNNEVPAVLVDLMHGCENPTVLVLSDKTKEFVRGELLAHIASMTEKPRGKIRLIVRQGDPNSLNELKEIGIESARGILIMNDKRSATEKLCSADFTGVLKLVLSLAPLNLRHGCPVGVETSTQQASDMMAKLKDEIEGLKDKQIQFFSHNRKLGQFLALAVICPELASALKRALCSRSCNFDIDDAKQRVAKAVPPKKLYVIGENKKYKYMVETLTQNKKNLTVKHYKTDDIDNFVADLTKDGDKDTVAVILSDESVDNHDYDANVFLTLLELSTAVGIGNRKFKIVAEIIDPNNQQSVEKFNVQNIVVSTEIISLFASKLLSDISAERYYEEIFEKLAGKA